MATAKQAAASRADAQNSTGPRTTQGQAASRYNALKHGIHAEHEIMFDESAEDLAELAAEYHEHHSPADSVQRLLVDTLIANEWRLRRMRRVEAVLWEHAADAFLAQHPEAEACNSAHAFATNAGYFERLQRMVNGCERNYHRALKELQSHQAEDAARGHALRTPQAQAGSTAEPAAAPAPEPSPTPQPQQSIPTSTSSASFRSNPKTPPPAVPQPPVAAPQPPPAPPFASPAAPASPPKTWQRPSNRFPTPQEAIDAALQAIFKESSPDL
jgi:hypothetical protein